MCRQLRREVIPIFVGKTVFGVWAGYNGVESWFNVPRHAAVYVRNLALYRFCRWRLEEEPQRVCEYRCLFDVHVLPPLTEGGRLRATVTAGKAASGADMGDLLDAVDRRRGETTTLATEAEREQL